MLQLLALPLLLAMQLPASPHTAERFEPGPPPTRLGLTLLAQDPLVAEVHTTSATPAGLGTAVVRLRVERLLRAPAGAPPPGELIVLAYDGHFRPGGSDLVWLVPYRSGRRWRVLEAVDGRDAEYGAKRELTAATIALEREPGAARREAATIELLLASLRGPSAWTAAYALGELRFLAATRPALFTTDLRARLSAASRGAVHPFVGPGVENVAAIAAAAQAPVASRPTQERPPR